MEKEQKEKDQKEKEQKEKEDKEKENNHLNINGTDPSGADSHGGNGTKPGHNATSHTRPEDNSQIPGNWNLKYLDYFKPYRVTITLIPRVLSVQE